jgi:hypothetical protein
MQVSKLRVNSTLYDSGRWVSKDTLPALEDMSFHVRALDCIEARRVRTERLMAMPEDERKNLTPHQSYVLDAAVIAHAVLVDWKGLEDENGEIKFDPEAAEAILANPDFRRLVDLIKTCSLIVQAEASIDVGSAAKN